MEPLSIITPDYRSMPRDRRTDRHAGAGQTDRHMDDMHDWSMYRQNLTSTLAKIGKKDTTYGGFRLRDETLCCVVKEGEASQLPTAQYLQFGLPRVHIDSLTLPRQPREMDRERRRAHSDWDLSGRKSDPCTSSFVMDDSDSQGSPPPPVQHYATSELHERPESSFTLSRHNAQYFSDLELYRETSSFNYLKYAKADHSAIRREVPGKPSFCVKQLHFERDLRSGIDKLLLRSPRPSRPLKGVSFELHAGETMAVLYTQEREVFFLLGALSSSLDGKASGQFVMNGHAMTAKQMGDRIAHASLSPAPPPQLTVQQYLHYVATLNPPSTNAFKVDNMIDQLLQTLALSPRRHESCESLGEAEKARLAVAAEVVKDTDILVVDDLTRSMDIYDAAFLIDYLRDWAGKLDRMVIMAIRPPSMEILQMFHKSAILSSGRFVYCGRADGMRGYFESIGQPCPPFKNPCDYYVDLVTPDHLTPSAAAESAERIGMMVEQWKRREQTQKRDVLTPPTGQPPPRKRRAGCWATGVAVYRSLLHSLLSSPLSFLFEPFSALLTSALLGLIYFDLPVDRRSGLNDRSGLIRCLIVYATWPVVAVNVINAHSFRRLCPPCPSPLHSLASAMARIALDTPFLLLTTVCLGVPVYVMSGMQTYPSLSVALLLFLALLLPHLIVWRGVGQLTGRILRGEGAGLVVAALLLSVCTLLSPLHSFSDQPASLRVFSPLSPLHWTAQGMMHHEYAGDSFLHSLLGFPPPSNSTQLLVSCPREKVLATMIKEIPIYTVTQCATMQGRQVMETLGWQTIGREDSGSVLEGFYVSVGWMSVVYFLQIATSFVRHEPSNEM